VTAGPPSPPSAGSGGTDHGPALRRRGQDVTIHEAAKIVSADEMEVGDSVIIDDFAFVLAGGGVRLGSFVHIGSHAFIGGGGGFVMEDFSGLSGGVRVYTGNEDYLGGQLTNPTVPAPWRVAGRDPVHIGRHAIVGSGTVVLPGVTIGEGAAVGALSVVARDVEPWTIYAGNPAKPIKDRPRARMLELEEDLRRTLYDADGRYIPRERRTP
jgi:acetyltransferase-like isoleucine patch superfamily enzyme